MSASSILSVTDRKPSPLRKTDVRNLLNSDDDEDIILPSTAAVPGALSITTNILPPSIIMPLFHVQKEANLEKCLESTHQFLMEKYAIKARPSTQSSQRQKSMDGSLLSASAGRMNPPSHSRPFNVTPRSTESIERATKNVLAPARASNFANHRPIAAYGSHPHGAISGHGASLGSNSFFSQGNGRPPILYPALAERTHTFRSTDEFNARSNGGRESLTGGHLSLPLLSLNNNPTLMNPSGPVTSTASGIDQLCGAAWDLAADALSPPPNNPITIMTNTSSNQRNHDLMRKMMIHRDANTPIYLPTSANTHSAYNDNINGKESSSNQSDDNVGYYSHGNNGGGGGSPEEEDRREKVLERNRVAAVRSRQKRKQDIDELNQTVMMMEKRHDELQDAIRRAKDHVFYLCSAIQAHKQCGSDVHDQALFVEVATHFSGTDATSLAEF